MQLFFEKVASKKAHRVKNTDEFIAALTLAMTPLSTANKEANVTDESDANGVRAFVTEQMNSLLSAIPSSKKDLSYEAWNSPAKVIQWNMKKGQEDIDVELKVEKGVVTSLQIEKITVSGPVVGSMSRLTLSLEGGMVIEKSKDGEYVTDFEIKPGVSEQNQSSKMNDARLYIIPRYKKDLS
jgi:hypothetical protein